MGSTLKVAIRPSQSRNVQSASSPKPKKQQGTQTAKAESRNFHQGKSRNLKIKTKQKTRKNPENSENQLVLDKKYNTLDSERAFEVEMNYASGSGFSLGRDEP
jgi:hypothetical protein